MGRTDKECCGNCCYRHKQGEEWFCENENSEYYGLEADYRDVCTDYERKQEE